MNQNKQIIKYFLSTSLFVLPLFARADPGLGAVFMTMVIIGVIFVLWGTIFAITNLIVKIKSKSLKKSEIVTMVIFLILVLFVYLPIFLKFFWR